MSQEDALKREKWIEAAQADIGRQVADCDIWPESSEWPGCIGDVIEQHYDAHRQTLPEDRTAELCSILRDSREWVERCRSLLHDCGCHEDAIACQVDVDRIDAVLNK